MTESNNCTIIQNFINEKKLSTKIFVLLRDLNPIIFLERAMLNYFKILGIQI